MQEMPLNRIRIVLAEKGLRSKDLQDGLGVNKNTVSKWINNHWQPSLTRLRDIANFLDVDIKDLLNSTK